MGGGSGGYYLELESTLHSLRNAPFSQISWVGSKKTYETPSPSALEACIDL